jgi:G2/mitotic-specific cyclin-B2
VKIIKNKITKTSTTTTTASTLIRREDSKLTRRSLTKLRAAFRREVSPETKKEVSLGVYAPSKSKEITLPFFFLFQITVFSPETHSSKLLDQVENIDSNDALNPLLMSEYVNDIYLYLNNLEIKYPVAKNHLEGQLEVSSVLLKTFRKNER